MTRKKTHQEYENELFEKGIDCIPVEKYVTAHTPILHQCFEDHTWEATPRHILQGSGCPHCSGLHQPDDEEYKAKLKELGIDLIPREHYINSRIAILHECPNGHLWKAIPTNIISGRGCPDCNRTGLYNSKYFQKYPEKAQSPGVLYVVVLVSKKTNERTCVKIGITKGSSFKDVIKRSAGFTGYDLRTQKIVTGTLEEVFNLEQKLHLLWEKHKYTKSHRFGGHTELFEIEKLPDILKSIQDFV